MFNSFIEHKRIHLLLSSVLTLVIGYYLIQVVLEQQYPKKSLYSGAEYRFVNLPHLRSSDFIVKEDNQQFLIAPNIPGELRAQIQLADAGRYAAKIEAQYPHWLCPQEDLDKAFVRIQGGSLNENVQLIRSNPQELSFTAAAGQGLTLRVTNPQNRECGRALLTLFRVTNPATVKMGIALLWLGVFGLCLFSASSLYIVTLGLLTNTLLILAEASLGELSTASVAVNTGLSLGFAGFLFFLASIPIRSRWIPILAVICIALALSPALSFIAYERVFSTPFSIEAVHGAMQSYGSQALEFWQEFVGKKRTLYLFFGLFLLYICLHHVNLAQTGKRKALVFGALLVMAAGALSIGRIHSSGVINLLLESAIVYRWEIDAFEKVASQRKTFTAEADRLAKHQDDTAVFVFGEAVNKKQMSAYGYLRQTTPQLDKRVAAGEVVLFTNAYSNHTHSNPTMSMILTQADQYSGKPWQESPSVFNYARASGVETHWLTNHRLLGGWSNNITTIVKEADRLETINFMIGLGEKSTQYDPDLVPLFKEAIQNRPNQLTFLHLYNSHSHYCNRYPKGSGHFDGNELPQADYGDLLRLRVAPASMINCYDSTIHYADSVLEQLINELNDRANPSMLVYVADHSEEFLDARTHNSALFTFDMINIPLMVWANEAWRKKHEDVWKTLMQNSEKVFTNDLMFETILGLAGIEAPSIDVTKDISSPNYAELDKPLTLHGRLPVDHDKNWNYWQRLNARFAKQHELDLIAVGVESLGEAKIALAVGIDKLQLTVDLSPENGLVLISNESKEPIVAVEDFLLQLNNSGVKSVALSIVPNANTTAAQFDVLVADIGKRSEIELTVAPANQINPIEFARVDFAKKVSEIAGGHRDRSSLIPIVLSSRYTDPPPEPN